MIQKKLLDLLVKHNLTLGAIESLTGGLFASSFTSVPGASQAFRGSLVTYSSEVKSDVAGVPTELISKHGVVSHEVARSMVVNAQRMLKSNVCVSFTGNAGPTALDGLPVGRIYVGIAVNDYVETFEFNLTNLQRNEVREKIVDLSCELLIKKIKEYF